MQGLYSHYKLHCLHTDTCPVNGGACIKNVGDGSEKGRRARFFRWGRQDPQKCHQFLPPWAAKYPFFLGITEIFGESWRFLCSFILFCFFLFVVLFMFVCFRVDRECPLPPLMVPLVPVTYNFPTRSQTQVSHKSGSLWRYMKYDFLLSY